MTTNYAVCLVRAPPTILSSSAFFIGLLIGWIGLLDFLVTFLFIPRAPYKVSINQYMQSSRYGKDYNSPLCNL